MKILLLVTACLIGGGFTATGEEPAFRARFNALDLLMWNRASVVRVHESCQRELDEIILRIQRDTEIAYGANKAAAKAARERIAQEKRRAKTLNEILERAMRAFPGLPPPRYYQKWKAVPRKLSPEELSKVLAGWFRPSGFEAAPQAWPLRALA